MTSLTDRSKFTYDCVLLLLRFITQIFFREVRPRGAFNIPRDGPVIFVAAPHNNQARLSIMYPGVKYILPESSSSILPSLVWRCTEKPNVVFSSWSQQRAWKGGSSARLLNSCLVVSIPPMVISLPLNPLSSSSCRTCSGRCQGWHRSGLVSRGWSLLGWRRRNPFLLWIYSQNANNAPKICQLASRRSYRSHLRYPIKD